jgi:NADPH:quinone reductase
MRTVVIEQFGDPSGLVLVDRPVPEPASDQVLVAVEAVGVGGVDAVIRRRTIGGSAFREGMVLGSEVAGRVTRVGAEVDPAWVGRRVWAFTFTGGYAEHAVAGIDGVVALPDGLSSVDAVTLGSAAPVAHFGLRHAQLAASDAVLIRGGSGSIGIAAVELAARAGARTVAVTTSSHERGRRLRALGATHVLDRSGRPLHPSTDDPALFDVILDIVGGPAVPEMIDRLAPNGRLVIVGAVAGMPPADFGAALLRSFQRSLTVGTLSLDTVPRDELRTARIAQFDAAARGELHAVVDDVLALDQAAEAHRRMDAGEVFGRIVLTP